MANPLDLVDDMMTLQIGVVIMTGVVIYALNQNNASRILLSWAGAAIGFGIKAAMESDSLVAPLVGASVPYIIPVFQSLNNKYQDYQAGAVASVAKKKV